jgi:hypothetical protein
MTDKPTADPLDLLQISKEVLAAQQNLMPTGQMYGRVAEAMRNVAQANATYMQELMRANAILLSAFTERRSGGTDERPSEAAHRPDSAAP